MTRPIAFILNTHAGQGLNRLWLNDNLLAMEAIAAGGPVSMVETGDQVRAAVAHALTQQCQTVVAGGGDGTLNAVASELANRPVALGVLPLGTLNHFARDLGIPQDPSVALECIAAGNTMTVDIGEVNGHFFLNNSSIGLYVDMVRDRDRQQTRLGRGKWLAFVWAVWSTLRRYPFLTVTLTFQGRAHQHRTPLVFVGNNTYRTEGLRIGQRDDLRAGVLGVYVTDSPDRWRLLGLGLRALVGRLRQGTDFSSLSTTELRIDTGHRWLRVATDGELRRLATPLHYRIHPLALRVIVPARAAPP